MSVRSQSCNGGARDVVELSDLPAPVRRAWTIRACEQAALPGGTYDEAAHARLQDAPAGMRQTAEERAAVARVLRKAAGLSWPDKAAQVRARCPGFEGASLKTLQRIEAAVEGVDPVNFAPALLQAYKGRTARADMSEDAWKHFLTTLDLAFKTYPLNDAWRRTRDTAQVVGWSWPSFATVRRRWLALTPLERTLILEGREAAVKRATQPIMRDRTMLMPLDIVSLDGRTHDVFVLLPDGRKVRPTMIALTDVASGAIIGWDIDITENATVTKRLILRTVNRYGLFGALQSDNGTGFSAHKITGGARHKFRKRAGGGDVIEVPGVCKMLGIAQVFSIPGNPKGKPVERSFADLSRQIDSAPEFAGAHAGHKPGDAPSGIVPVPLDLFLKVVEREIARYNAEPGRRGQGMRGRSYWQAFTEGLAIAPRPRATQRQMTWASLDYRVAAVDRHGRVAGPNGWVYGGPDTMDALLRHHGDGKRILLGYNPDDFEQPAVAVTFDFDKIAEGIQPVKRTAWRSVDGAREAASNAKAARKLIAEGEAKLDLMTRQEWEAYPLPIPETPAPAAGGVVQVPFGDRVTKPAPAQRRAAVAEELPGDDPQALDRWLAQAEKRKGLA